MGDVVSFMRRGGNPPPPRYVRVPTKMGGHISFKRWLAVMGMIAFGCTSTSSAMFLAVLEYQHIPLSPIPYAIPVCIILAFIGGICFHISCGPDPK